MKVGVIGLGNMGKGIALNLRKAGNEMMVHDARREVAEVHLTAGSAWGEAPREVAEFAEVVFTSLPGRRRSRPLHWARTACWRA